MAHIVFYEKPGCINNTKQKKLLRAAGHDVEERNLLTEQWNKQSLLNYFRQMPVSNWFNRSAPDIKSGSVDPDDIDENSALELMINNPLLIRRPLMQVGNEFRAGFDNEEVNQWIGIIMTEIEEDLETCPRSTGQEG